MRGLRLGFLSPCLFFETFEAQQLPLAFRPLPRRSYILVVDESFGFLHRQQPPSRRFCTLLVLACCEVGEVELCRSLAKRVLQLGGIRCGQQQSACVAAPRTVSRTMVEIYTVEFREPWVVPFPYFRILDFGGISERISEQTAIDRSRCLATCQGSSYLYMKVWERRFIEARVISISTS